MQSDTAAPSAPTTPAAYFFQPMSTCPTGTQVLLHGVSGNTVLSSYNGRDTFWVAWAPTPKQPEWLKELKCPKRR